MATKKKGSFRTEIFHDQTEAQALAIKPAPQPAETFVAKDIVYQGNALYTVVMLYRQES